MEYRTIWKLNMKIKQINSAPNIFMNVPSVNQLGKESNSLEIGSQARRVNTHRAMDKQSSPKFQRPLKK